MYNKFVLIIILFLYSFCPTIILAQKNSVESIISDSLTKIANKYSNVGKVNITGFMVNKTEKKITIIANEQLSYIPFRPENVTYIYNTIKKIISEKYPDYALICKTDSRNIEDLIPNLYRVDNIDLQKQWKNPREIKPVSQNLSRPFKITKGLFNKNLAVWQSHGYYFNQKQNRWEWQRPRLFQTVEDLYTQSYVLPFLVPMLENAGANVFVPRERDPNKNEVIVDNDTKNSSSRYREINDRKSWKPGGEGFGNIHRNWFTGENPFNSGTFRYIQTVPDDEEISYAEWTPNIPESGNYAVYISYKTLENSTTDARYKIYHLGGVTEFSVNQTVNGGTWLYLGNYKFEAGKSNKYKVVVSNFSSSPNRIVTADAVKFGGGMGNIARKPNQNGAIKLNFSTDSLTVTNQLSQKYTVYEAQTSGYPRFTEGARYWLQWAGMPDSIYSRTKGENDYSDDFQSRGYWVNYLSGGSAVNPSMKGLGVPIDMAFAFHTDAGLLSNDSIIGTLGICTVQNTAGKTSFANNTSRWTSRDLTDIIQTQIVNDIRKNYAPEWSHRGIWNKSYSESRTPEVPAMLLELLSHQNFADMRYGLDPRFRFTVCRAIYKGILKYLNFNSGTEYEIQPMPVEQFSCRFIEKNKVELKWNPVVNNTEENSTAKKFVIYTRINDGGFNNGILTQNNKVVLEIQSGKIYSFRVTAVNDGGESFPSEILSAYRAPNEHGEVIIINGFDRISGPESFTTNGNTAGFLNNKDAGVPYISDISFVGSQYEFQRNKKYIDNNSPGFGASYQNFETEVIAGNNFDFPYVHGKAIKAAGFSFVSASLKSVLAGDIEIANYKYVDLILGKQKQTYIGNKRKSPEFKTFPLALQQKIRNYCQAGGNLFVSGAYIASDLYEKNYIKTEEKQFLENTLKIRFISTQTCSSDIINLVNAPLIYTKKTELKYNNKPNESVYCIETADAIEPADQGAFTFCTYNESNLSAGVVYSGKYKICCTGFPFETLISEKERFKLMDSVLSFFSKKIKDKLY